jgi:DNA-binding NtrC family response regulator
MNTFAVELWGGSAIFESVLRTAQLVALTDATTLVLGETGTGKELLARAMHRASRRAGGPFVAVNCAALPEGLALPALFGHRKGAFTGAVAHQPGYVQSAGGGTLFLDEIAELPLESQAKLLRLLESGEYQPVGEALPQRVDVRVIAATHRDLGTQVKAGRFREDLYYRLYVVPVELPPLRERGGDVELLVRLWTARLAEQHGLAPPRYEPAALKLLGRYRWPGNVRELRNFCERMAILRSGLAVGPAQLPAEMRQGESTEPARQAGGFALPESGLNLFEVERYLIVQALERTAGNRSRAARLLGLSRDTLLYRMKKYCLE